MNARNSNSFYMRHQKARERRARTAPKKTLAPKQEVAPVAVAIVQAEQVLVVVASEVPDL